MYKLCASKKNYSISKNGNMEMWSQPLSLHKSLEYEIYDQIDVFIFSCDNLVIKLDEISFFFLFIPARTYLKLNLTKM